MNKTGIMMLMMLLTGCATNGAVKQVPVANWQQAESMAITAYASSNWLESEKYYTQLVTSPGHKPGYWYRLGNIYAFTNRPDAAVVAYREALRQDPELAEAWFNLGMVQLKQATYSFGQLQLHNSKGMETGEQGKKILQGILELMPLDTSE